MRGFETHEVPKTIFAIPQSALDGLQRPTHGAAFICAEKPNLGGVTHLPSIWVEGEQLQPRCNCPDSINPSGGWCRHTETLAALWMKHPWSFEGEEAAPTTPFGTLEPCRRSSRALDRFAGFMGLVMQHGLLRVPVASEFEVMAQQLLSEGLNRMAWRLNNCAGLFRQLTPDGQGPAVQATERLLEALHATRTIRRLMSRSRIVETVHDEWLGSITSDRSAMPIRHRHYLELGRSRFTALEGAVTLKRYWIDLTSGEVVSDELPEEERVEASEGAQVLHLRRGYLHPGFTPRWLEALQGQEEPAQATDVGAALDRFVRGTTALVGAWRKRQELEEGPEDWVGGVARVSLVTGERAGELVLEDGRGPAIPLGGDWPQLDELPQGVMGAFGRVLVTAQGLTLFPLALLTGEEVLLAPPDLPFPMTSLLSSATLGETDGPLHGLKDLLLRGSTEPGRWGSLFQQLERQFSSVGGEAKASGPSPGADEVAAAWGAVRKALFSKLVG